MDMSYKTAYIKSKSGKKRKLSIPNNELKKTQKKALIFMRNLEIPEGYFSHGGVRGRSQVTNAEPHVGNKIMIKLDISDFFGNVTGPKCNSLKKHMSFKQMENIKKLCFLDNSLPQGAPSSPMLANIACLWLDKAIVSMLCATHEKKDNVAYTRFVDDMTVSGNYLRIKLIISRIKSILNSYGFSLNTKKTRVLRKRRMITGIVVNEKISAPRKLRKQVRAAIFQFKVAVLKGEDVSSEKIQKLQGKVGYIFGVNKEQGLPLRRAFNEVLTLRSLKASLIGG